MANLNNEGFAIAPQAECVNGLKPTFYADDSNTGGHALRTGTIACKPSRRPRPTPTPSPQPTPNTQQPGGRPGAHGRPHGPAAQGRAQARQDHPPQRQAHRHHHAQRAREPDHQLAKPAPSTLLQTTRSNVAAGKPTITLSLKRSVRRGQKLTVTVQARDAAGNVTTRTISAKAR